MDDAVRDRGGDIYAALKEYNDIHNVTLQKYGTDVMEIENRLFSLDALNIPKISFAQQLLIAAHFLGNLEDCAFAVSLLQKTYGGNATKATEDNDLVVLHVAKIKNVDQRLSDARIAGIQTKITRETS